MARKGSKSLANKRRITRRKEEAGKIGTPPKNPPKKITEDEPSEVSTSDVPEGPVKIKQELLDTQTERILEFVVSGQDCEINSDVEKNATPVSSTSQEEIVCVDNVPEEAIGEEQSVEVEGASELVTPSADTPSASPDEPKDTHEDQDSFEVEGECIIRIAGEDIRGKKVDIIPFAGNIGFIGCGPMAEAYIAQLIRTRHKVYGYNRTAEKWTDVLKRPTVVSTPASLVEKCDIIFCCVRDSAAVKDIMEKPKGVLEGMDHHPGKAYVEMSSVDPDTISKYSQEVNARGGTYLNAQIWRTRPAAYLACSIIKASGDRETFEKCCPCFASFSSVVEFMSSNVVDASIASISYFVKESLPIIILSDSMLAADKMGVPKQDFVVGIEMSHSQKSEILGVAATIMIYDKPDVFIPLRHVVKNLRWAIKLKKLDLFGNELILTGLQVCNEVLNQYPEAAEHDISCLYKLRTDPYVRPIEIV